MGPKTLSGRVVLITGAESGIGRQTALLAASQGAAVAAIGLDDTGLGALVRDVRGLGRPAEARVADVTDAGALGRAVEALVGQLGPLHVAHANAGVLIQATTIDDLNVEDWNRVLAVNLTGVLLTFQAALRHFSPDGGALLATGSSTAVRPGTGLLPYVAAKAGVHVIARSLALELAPRGIRVNVIAPGLTDTAMTTSIPGHIERGMGAVPLGRVIQPAEVASLAVYLMSEEARAITGSVFVIDAGRTAV
jgi:NAD(P)-dependent dehydrogenase (short-subunit alcohol dehydrogenase family)